jgi:uncharacterized protein (DUF58 family)
VSRRRATAHPPLSGPERAARPERPRPEGLLGTLSGGLALLALWGAVAHASGSEWVQAIGTLVAGVLVVGVAGPLLSLRRVELVVEQCPAEGRSGEPLAVTVVASRPCRLVPLRPAGAACQLRSRTPAVVELLPGRRGELAALTCRVSSAAPLGLVWWAGTCRIRLPRTVSIAPSFAPSQTRSAGSRSGEDREGPHTGGGRGTEQGELRGVREYRVGDSPRRVHWRASAHTGGLMVREAEDGSLAPVRIVADLPPDPDEAELRASEAMTAVRAALESRRAVVLETNEAHRPRVGAVQDLGEAGRRLARAGINPWSDLGPEGPEER